MTSGRMTSAAAFVAGGVQDAFDDTCSICLENFSDDDPAMMTACKHEYHLQCILEWSQRSKECPMCWQALSVKDPDGEGLLNQQSSSPYYQPFPRDDSDIHNLMGPYEANLDMEDHIMQHLAAAVMSRAQHFARRGESLRLRPSHGQGHPHLIIVPAHSNLSSTHLSSFTLSPSVDISPLSLVAVPDVLSLSGSANPAAAAHSTAIHGSSMAEAARGARNMEASSAELCSLRQQGLLDTVEGSPHGTSSSELSFSETIKNRLAAASSRYRESLTKTTRGFKERLRVRNGAIAELGTRVREVSTSVVRALEQMSLDLPDKSGNNSSLSNSSASLDKQVGTSSALVG